MFDFVWKTKESFKKVKEDMEDLKKNMNEWVLFLDGSRDETEKEMEKLDARMERMEEAMFKILSLR